MTSDRISKIKGHWDGKKIVQVLLVIFLFIFTITLNISRAVRAE